MTKTQRRLLTTTVLVAIGAPQLETQAPASRPATTGWRVKFDASGSSPVVADGVLYVGSADGAVYAVSPVTGDIKWRFQTGEGLAPATGPAVITVPPGSNAIQTGLTALERQLVEGRRRVDMAPAVANGTVLIGSGDRFFYSIDAVTGQRKWSYEAGVGMASRNNFGFPQPAALVRNGNVYFVTDDGLHAVDALTGKAQWRFETLEGLAAKGVGKRLPSGPLLSDGAFFLTAWPYGDPLKPGKSFLYAVDASSGKARWVTSVNGKAATKPVTANGFAFFAVEDNSTSGPLSDRATLYAVDAADGQVKWKFGAALKLGSLDLLVAANTIYFCTDQGVSALELATGRQLWTFNSAGLIGPLLADDQRLYVVTADSRRPRVRALALATGQEQWSQRVNARLAMIHDGVAYLSGDRIYALETTTGKELWSFKGTGRESARLIADGRLFLTSDTLFDLGGGTVDQGFLSALDARTGRLTPAR